MAKMIFQKVIYDCRVGSEYGCSLGEPKREGFGLHSVQNQLQQKIYIS
jgi:hypothetical protein